MFVCTSGFQKSLAHTDFNMFMDEWTSANKSRVGNVIYKCVGTVFIFNNMRLKQTSEISGNERIPHASLYGLYGSHVIKYMMLTYNECPF